MKKAVIWILFVCAVFLSFALGVLAGKHTAKDDIILRSDLPTVQQETVSSNYGKIDLNTATVSDLMDLEGIGEVIARRIVDYRKVHGEFHSVYDLLNVEGIGEKKLQVILDYVFVGG